MDDKLSRGPFPIAVGGRLLLLQGVVIPVGGAALLRSKSSSALTRGGVDGTYVGLSLLLDTSRAVQNRLSQVEVLGGVAEERGF